MRFRDATLEAEKKGTYAFNQSSDGVPILVYKLDRCDWDILWKHFDSVSWRVGGLKEMIGAWDVIESEMWEVGSLEGEE